MGKLRQPMTLIAPIATDVEHRHLTFDSYLPQVAGVEGHDVSYSEDIIDAYTDLDRKFDVVRGSRCVVTQQDFDTSGNMSDVNTFEFIARDTTAPERPADPIVATAEELPDEPPPQS